VGANGQINDPKLTIPRSVLRRGDNRITLIAYNAEGGRGERRTDVTFDDGTKVVRTLRALVVGVNNYKNVKGFGFANLKCCVADAREMVEVFEQHKGSGLYDKVIVKPVLEQNATAANILKELAALAKGASPDDWLVVFLAGHGHAKQTSVDDYEPGSFFFVCTNTDEAVPNSRLTTAMLTKELEKVTCAKLLILDCCRSGAIKSNPVRDLQKDGVPILVLSACKAEQSALEAGKHGLFTQCLLDAIKPAAEAKGKKRDQLLPARELQLLVETRLRALLTKFDQDPDEQTPEFFPAILPPRAVLCKPKE
jgi:uncharacterized caspase-like protein